MPYIPRNQDEIYENWQSRVEERTKKLTNFEEGTLNHTLGYHGFSGYFNLFEHVLLAVQLSGWIEFAGGPITEEDLIRLDIPPQRVNLPVLNRYMDDQDLEELALQNGVTRDPGGKAMGDVVFMTNDSDVVIPEGTEVTTADDSFSEVPLSYYTLEEAVPEPGTTRATVMVEAERVGPDYNIGSGSIRRMQNPPAGVRDVRNPSPITGGEPPETNEELRERAKQAITQRSGGGTAAGIRGGIVNLIDGVDADNVYIDEHYDPPGDAPPYVEVTVDGGEDDEVEDAIELLHSCGVRHIMNRPTTYVVDVTASLTGSPININRAEEEIARYLAELGLGENVNRAALITSIMNSDDDIENISFLEISTDRTGAVEGDLVLDSDEKASPGHISVSL